MFLCPQTIRVFSSVIQSISQSLHRADLSLLLFKCMFLSIFALFPVTRNFVSQSSSISVALADGKHPCEENVEERRHSMSLFLSAFGGILAASMCLFGSISCWKMPLFMVPVWFHLIPSDHSSLSGGTVPSLGSPSCRIAGISYCWQSLEYLIISYSTA